MGNSAGRIEVSRAEFANIGSPHRVGTLRQVSLHEWKEDGEPNIRDRFTLTETGRDEWSIYLFDTSRKVSLQIDCFQKKIYYSDRDTKRRVQYDLLHTSSTPTGWLVNRVDAGSDQTNIHSTFKQISATGWTEDKPDGTTVAGFTETGRDDWSVYLRDAARLVTIQLDLFRQIVVYQEAGGAKQDLYKIIAALTKVNGWLANRIDYTEGGPHIAGSLLQTGAKAWIEENAISGRGRNEFQETNRDEWSIYLHDPSRNVSLQLDLFKATVFYTDAKTPRRALYAIAAADILPKLGLDNGKTVNVVTYGDDTGKTLGHFRQTSEQTWSESKTTAGAVAFAFDEIARDDWSVYLYDATRDIWAQLDLFRNKVSTHEGNEAASDLYDILSTDSVLNGHLVNAVGYDTGPGQSSLLRQVGWTSWVECNVHDKSIENHFDETGRDDWSVDLNDPSRGVNLQIDLFRGKIVYSSAKEPPRDIYDIALKSHERELWRLPHRISSRSSLTQDFDVAPNGGAPTPRPAYRTSISVPTYVTSVDVWASEEVTLSINNTSYTLDPVKTVRVTPSAAAKLAVSIPATTLGCPTLFLRTNLMQATDFHIVMPDVEVHQKIGELKDGALYDARRQLGIDPRFDDKPGDIAAVQKGIQSLVATVQYSYNNSYHGVHHDRGLLPENMDDPHFVLDFSGGGAKYVPLTAAQVTAQTHGARRVAPGAAQGLFGELFETLGEIGTVWVHTAEDVGGVAIDTAGRALGDVVTAVSAAGEHVIHGDVLGGVEELFKGGENLGLDLIKGTLESATKTAEGAGKVLLLTLKFGADVASEFIQFLIEDCGPIGEAIASVLDTIGAKLGEFIGWILNKVGWSDVLHTHDVIKDLVNARLDKGVSVIQDIKKTGDEFFANLIKQIDINLDEAEAALGVPSLNTQPQPPESFSGAMEQCDWLTAKFSDDKSGSSIQMSLSALTVGANDGLVGDLIAIIESKIGSDGSKILGAFGDAFEHLKRVFTGSQTPVQDLLGAALELARAAAHIVIDVLSAIMDAVLDLLAGCLATFKTVANAAITIPFVSAFYQGLNDGRQLTALSLAALLVAIPTTIIYEAIEGKPIFGHLGVAQSATSDDGPVSLSSEMQWLYAASQGCLAVTSAVNDYRVYQSALSTLKAAPIDAGLKGDGFADAEDEPGAVNAPQAVPMKSFNKAWGIRAVPDPVSVPSYNVLVPVDKVLTVVNIVALLVSVIGQVAGAPLPPGQSEMPPPPSAAVDVLEAPNYVGTIIFWLEAFSLGLNILVFSATTGHKIRGKMTAGVDSLASDVMAVVNTGVGAVHLALSVWLCVADGRKFAALNDAYNAKLLNEETGPNALLHYQQLAGHIYASTNFGGAASKVLADDADATLYINNLVAYWNNLTPFPIAIKTLGNLLDALPELAQIGTLSHVVKMTGCDSLIATGAADLIGHGVEGTIYLVRIYHNQLY